MDGPDGLTGSRTLTITLDLTGAAGYNGTTNFGTVTWADSLLGTLGTFTYPSARDFGSLFISGANAFTGGISNLSFTQILPTPPANTFEAWVEGFGLAASERDFTDDPDGDGLANGIEHVLGTSPAAFSSGVSAESATTSSLTFRHPLNAALATNVAYSPQWSTDLVEWRASGQMNAAGTRATVVSSAPDGGGIITVTISITEGAAATLFGRVAATLAP